MIEIPVDLPSEIVPFSWLLGVWEGEGRIVTGKDEAGNPIEVTFRQRASFSHDGGAHLNYRSELSLVADADEALPQVFTSESGYWRLARPHDDGDIGPGILPATAPATITDADAVEKLRDEDGTFPIEVVLAHPTGVAEIYYGKARGPRIDLATDFVARTPNAKEHSASTRMYGFVEGDLLWVWDIAAQGQPLASHASARLSRVD
ncbi:FABP family protein [Pseudoclavibacter albus]|uniref:FABP family protein n=1 Tax=Pseudoclavibacter albus TaxID=272241 RepID=UPI0008264763|nr:FABP family protein [Pseudoclavibacter alba]